MPPVHPSPGHLPPASSPPKPRDTFTLPPVHPSSGHLPPASSPDPLNLPQVQPDPKPWTPSLASSPAQVPSSCLHPASNLPPVHPQPRVPNSPHKSLPQPCLNPTLPQPHPASTPLCLNPTLPQPHSASTPLCLNPTLPQPHSASTPLCPPDTFSIQPLPFSATCHAVHFKHPHPTMPPIHPRPWTP
ncbi:uncharacterized protein LOC129816566 [Salvelinus fontinalis]|uniref:uncharacterized protein LOC129816566 n=1 Tax=Salvelinus fontinalis TaxID=8038 RepID=UPI0024854178|nr:uncharacterized protein LOC129816566 [Salvelinus fontinalis]